MTKYESIIIPPPPIDVDDNDDWDDDPAYKKNYILPLWSKCGKWRKQDFGYSCCIVQCFPGAFVYVN